MKNGATKHILATILVLALLLCLLPGTALAEGAPDAANTADGGDGTEEETGADTVVDGDGSPLPNGDLQPNGDPDGDPDSAGDPGDPDGDAQDGDTAGPVSASPATRRAAGDAPEEGILINLDQLTPDDRSTDPEHWRTSRDKLFLAQEDGVYTLTGDIRDSGLQYVTVDDDVSKVTVTLRGASMEGFECASAAVELWLEGDNVLEGEGVSVNKGASLAIRGNGALRAVATISYTTGIGAKMWQPCGKITIYSGRVIATGGRYAAGIGSSAADPQNGNNSEIVIAGGVVTATGGARAAGIGGALSDDGGKITITGGAVEAFGGEHAAGIGGGEYGAAGEISISGGEVRATGGEEGGAGIGGGRGGISGGEISISGGEVRATGGEEGGAGIGGGRGGRGGEISISGGEVRATSTDGVGIGSASPGAADSVTIGGDAVVSASGYTSLYDIRSESITIDGGSVRLAINSIDPQPASSGGDALYPVRVNALGGGAARFRDDYHGDAAAMDVPTHPGDSAPAIYRWLPDQTVAFTLTDAGGSGHYLEGSMRGDVTGMVGYDLFLPNLTPTAAQHTAGSHANLVLEVASVLADNPSGVTVSAVLLDRTALDNAHFTVNGGEVTVHGSYLATLASGSYELAVGTVDDVISTIPLTVGAAPATGGASSSGGSGNGSSNLGREALTVTGWPGSIAVGDSFPLTASIGGGTWSFDGALLDVSYPADSILRNPATFTGLVPGTVTVTYTLGDRSVSGEVRITGGEEAPPAQPSGVVNDNPATGGDSTDNPQTGVGRSPWWSLALIPAAGAAIWLALALRRPQGANA